MQYVFRRRIYPSSVAGVIRVALPGPRIRPVGSSLVGKACRTDTVKWMLAVVSIGHFTANALEDEHHTPRAVAYGLEPGAGPVPHMG